MRKWILILIALPCLAQEKIETDLLGTEIDWFKLKITAKLERPVPKLVLDPEDPEYRKPGTSDSTSFSKIKKSMKETLRLNLSQKIESIYYDSNSKISEFALGQRRERLNEYFFQELEVFQFHRERNTLQAKSSINFLGKQGLLAYLPTEYEKEEFPLFSEKVSPEAYSGLVVDAKHLPLKTALFPKILSDRGLEIYSPIYVKEAYALEMGYIQYRTGGFKDTKIGKKPYYVVALGLSGKNETDLVLASTDVLRILAHPETRKNLKQCRVLILVSD